MTGPTIAIGYVRGDTDSAASAERQREAIHTYCDERRIFLSCMVFESGQPGVGLERVLDELNAGSANMLIVYRLGMLISRSAHDLIRLAESSEKHGWQLIVVDAVVSPAQWGFRASDAQNERTRTAD